MAYKNIVESINVKLSEKESPSDPFLSLTMPGNILKKNSQRYNKAIIDVYNDLLSEEITMKEILLAVDEYYEISWLVENVLSTDVISILSEETNINI